MRLVDYLAKIGEFLLMIVMAVPVHCVNNKSSFAFSFDFKEHPHIRVCI